MEKAFENLQMTDIGKRKSIGIWQENDCEIQLIRSKGKGIRHFGHYRNNICYLYPEEGLVAMEKGYLWIYTEQNHLLSIGEFYQLLYTTLPSIFRYLDGYRYYYNLGIHLHRTIKEKDINTIDYIIKTTKERIVFHSSTDHISSLYAMNDGKVVITSPNGDVISYDINTQLSENNTTQERNY